MINVVLADDQDIVREGLKMLLSLDEEINILGEAENGESLLQLMEGIQTDVVLVDILMPKMNGIDATKQIKEKYPSVKVIILTTFNEDDYIFQGLKNGADGYILKDSGSEDIIKAIKCAYNGNILLNPEVTTKVVRALNRIQSPVCSQKAISVYESKLQMLTPRELEVAQLIASGKSNKNVCEILFLTEGTVKNYVTRILEKLELASRTELALFMQQMQKL